MVRRYVRAAAAAERVTLSPFKIAPVCWPVSSRSSPLVAVFRNQNRPARVLECICSQWL